MKANLSGNERFHLSTTTDHGRRDRWVRLRLTGRQQLATKPAEERRQTAYSRRLCDILEWSLAGFYTLSAYGINHTEANGWLKRNSPDPIPAILLGMLGVDIRYQTMHIGSQLLRDATLRASNAAEIVGAKALFVEPASDSATKFYEHYGFRHIERSTKMFLPLKRN